MNVRFLSILLAGCMLSPPVSAHALVEIPCSAESTEDSEEHFVTVDNLVFELHGNFASVSDVVDKNVTSLKIPAYVEGVVVLTGANDGNVFCQCSNLINFEVEDGGSYSAIDGVLFSSNGQRLIAYPVGREGSYVVPDGTEEIGIGAFYKASGLTEITLPESLKSIGTTAFHYCTSLREIHGKIKETYGNLFVHCHSLKRIEFAEATNEYEGQIAELQVVDCPALEEIIIPKSRGLCVTNIAGCDALQELVFPQPSFVYMNIVGCHNLKKITFLQPSCSPHSLKISECDTAVIYGYSSNENLQNVCAESGLDFVPIGLEEYQIGDIDGSGEIDIVDVLAINQYLVGVHQPSDAGIISADVDHNGVIDDADAMKILKSLVKLDTLE